MSGPGRQGPRVVLVVGRSTGGIGVHVGQLATDLRAGGAEVRVVTHAATAAHFGWADALPWWPDDARSLARWSRRVRALAHGADAVHAHGLQAGLAVVLALGPHPVARVAVSLHNPPPVGTGARARALRRVTSRVLRRADLVTGASADLVDLARAWGAPRVRLAPVPSPLVPGLLAAPVTSAAQRGQRAEALGLGAGPQRPLLLTVARAAPQKRLDLVVAAAQLLAGGPEVVWAVAGAGEPAELARWRAAAQGTAVRFLGARDDVDALLRAASVVVVTSDWEARALVGQEAMAAGVPVVATGVGGLPQLLGGSGRLVPPGSAADLASALDGVLDELAHDPAALTAGVLRGRALAAAWPDGAQTAQHWARWYAGAGGSDPLADDLD